MLDREKVIKAVETCFDSWIDRHRNMGYDLQAVELTKRDALKLLAPRILDLDELQFHPHVWYEVSNGTNPIPALVVPPRTVARQRIIVYQPVFETVIFLPENDCYKRTWRCWSAEPTEEQRKAAKWMSTKK